MRHFRSSKGSKSKHSRRYLANSILSIRLLSKWSHTLSLTTRCRQMSPTFLMIKSLEDCANFSLWRISRGMKQLSRPSQEVESGMWLSNSTPSEETFSRTELREGMKASCLWTRFSIGLCELRPCKSFNSWLTVRWDLLSTFLTSMLSSGLLWRMSLAIPSWLMIKRQQS